VSVRAHPRAVGMFVLGAVAIVLAAIVTFSSRDWFVAKDRFAIFIPGSVRGLTPGAPVTFRGVKVGEVKEVTAFLTGKPDPFIEIEVVIEFSRQMIQAAPGVGQPWAAVRGPELARRLIDSGIRARMLSQSLLTGQKYIDLDFLPNDKARFAGLSRRYPELPTTTSSIEKLSQKGEELVDKLAALPVDQMLEDLRQALGSLRALLDSRDLRGSLGGARRSMDALAPTLDDARVTLAELRRLSQSLDGQMKGTAAEAQQTARQLRQTLERAEQTLGELETLAHGTDDARVEASRTLQDLSRTLAAVRQLAEYLETHPEALVSGKPKDEEKKR
jgi:paraquat-inducible protein B